MEKCIIITLQGRKLSKLNIREDIMSPAKIKLLLSITIFSSLCAVSQVSQSVGNLSVTKEVNLKASPNAVLPIPIIAYVSTISVIESGLGMPKVEWLSTFDVNNVSNEKAIEAIAGIYDVGLNNLANQ